MTGFPFLSGSFGEFAFGDFEIDIPMIIDTAAAVTAAGQDVLASIAMALNTAAGVSMAGQTVLATLGMVISTSAMVTAAGQEVNLWPRMVTGPLFQRKLASGRAAVFWRGRTN